MWSGRKIIAFHSQTLLKYILWAINSQFIFLLRIFIMNKEIIINDTKDDIIREIIINRNYLGTSSATRCADISKWRGCRSSNWVRASRVESRAADTDIGIGSKGSGTMNLKKKKILISRNWNTIELLGGILSKDKFQIVRFYDLKFFKTNFTSRYRILVLYNR